LAQSPWVLNKIPSHVAGQTSLSGQIFLFTAISACLLVVEHSNIVDDFDNFVIKRGI
jgi:hypothetical protein